MLSQNPSDLNKVNIEDIDKEILRLAIIGELDAINLYEQLSAKANNPIIKKVLLDIAKEEKTHVGELQALLILQDKEQREELKNGEAEIKEKLSNN
ncbi:MAG: ferritin family protein [Patescibacteria group bacterium]